MIIKSFKIFESVRVRQKVKTCNCTGNKYYGEDFQCKKCDGIVFTKPMKKKLYSIQYETPGGKFYYYNRKKYDTPEEAQTKLDEITDKMVRGDKSPSNTRFNFKVVPRK